MLIENGAELRIFVTGGAGFIGANFILMQLNNTENIILNYDKLTYAGNLKSLDSIKNDSKYKFIKGDICNREHISKTINQFKPNCIINFAAESHVDRSIDLPFQFIQTNIVGTATLLDESLKYFNNLAEKMKEKFIFLHVSTDEVYGSLDEEGLFSENTAYDPSSPYSASKASSDHLVRAWHRTFGLPVIITNCSNNYGPFQFPEKLIPLIILNCLSEKSLPIYGTGENIRDWLYVEDHCDALYKVLIEGQSGHTFNIGGNNEIRNIEIVKIICDKMDRIYPRKNNKSYKELIKFVKDRPGHDFRYAIDASKIKHTLNWEPKENFITGIDKTIHWYMNNSDWWQDIKSINFNEDSIGN